MKIVDDLYFYPWESYTQNNSNSILVKGQTNMLVDPGHAHLLQHLVPQLEADGVTLDQIGLVVYTHSHPDHMEAGSLVARHGAKQAIHADEEAYFRKTGPDFFRAMGLSMPEINIDFHLTDGELKVGEKTFQVFLTPGHSPGEICLYWPDGKILISGDLIFAQGVGRTDFPGGNGAQLKDSIRRMSELDIEAVLPGHGPAVIGRDNVVRNFSAIERMYFPIL